MKVVIFLNSATTRPQTLDLHVQDAKLLIGADGGANLCSEWGLKADIVIGDFDSIKPDLLQLCKNDPAVEVFQHPTRKDQTDLELAMDLAIARGGKEILLAGALGHRWDMSLATLLIGTQEKYQQISLSIIDPDCLISLHRPGIPYSFHDLVGKTVSFLPLGEISGLYLEGFEYDLEGDTLPCGSSRGVSNIINSSPASLHFSEGLLVSVILGAF
ncbi:MAG: thiamine diphosphokinase [Desulfobulbaceae bacterium]|nr:MAG: thiamine diphosphokinase [Desulfobulbaceae bacterium]